MFKVTPNPPDLDAPDTDPPGSDSVSPYETLDPKKLHAAERALNFYLKPAVTMNNTERKPGTIYMIAPDVAHETLLVHACENMASARVMTSNVAASLEGTHRSNVLALQQIIMLEELAMNRMLDTFVPRN